MLLHTIKVHKEPALPPPPVYNQGPRMGYLGELPVKITRYTSKVDYGRWLSSRRVMFRRGDYCIERSAVDGARTKEVVHRVVQWQEIQMFLKFDDKDNVMAMEVADHLGNRRFVNHEEWMFIPDPVVSDLRFECPIA